mgnify:CR=1 FL=1
MKIEIKRETSEVFFSAIDVGEVFYYDAEDKIYMKINESRNEDNAYNFSTEITEHFDPDEKVVPVKSADLIIKI